MGIATEILYTVGALLSLIALVSFFGGIGETIQRFFSKKERDNE